MDTTLQNAAVSCERNYESHTVFELAYLKNREKEETDFGHFAISGLVRFYVCLHH